MKSPRVTLLQGGPAQAPPQVAGPAPKPAHSLSNGSYTVLLTGAGSGGSTLKGVALTRWSGDPVDDREGYFFYLRDLDKGDRFWGLTAEPGRQPADRYRVAWAPGGAAITREEMGIEATMEVRVAEGAPLELRRVTLRNLSPTPRKIELTSYAEVVLASPESDAAHPAFSKLFVQTEYVREAQALLAHRRPRARGESGPWLFHALPGEGSVEWETDRARFVGRGCTRGRPKALRAPGPLSGTTGSVLDPVVSLRRIVTLAPGAVSAQVFLLGAADSRDEALGLVAQWSREGVADAEFRAAGEMVEDSEAAQAAFPAASGGKPDGSGEAMGWAPQVWEPDFLKLDEPLEFFNGFGGFAEVGTEYVIRMLPEGPRRLRLPPAPWINVLANEQFGCLVSETGAGCTWSGNSRENRVTPWSNDPILDPHGEALYLRDEVTGEFWSPLAGPTPGGGAYEMRHGFGYSRCRSRSHGLDLDTVVFVPRDLPVKVTLLRVINTSGRARSLTLTAAHCLANNATAEGSTARRITAAEPEAGAVTAHTPGGALTFAALAGPGGALPSSCGSDRATFLGYHGGLDRPAAMLRPGALDGRFGDELQPCLSLRGELQLEPGASVECVVLLGECPDREEMKSLVARLRKPGAAAHLLAEVRAFWTRTLGGVRVETPSRAIDLMVNGWLAYQNLSCRMWGRTAFYQSGGAFGFRDQLQDSVALCVLRPDLTRAQLLLHAAHQFVEGDVQHWWHPPLDRGIRTRFADDLLWLPFSTVAYIGATGDTAVLDEVAPFLTGRQLEEGEDEAFFEPERSGQPGDLYEHCVRALDRSLRTGIHGLPLMGSGDWNDGMNRVGREGRGESVWMGFFLYSVLGDFTPLCELRGDGARVSAYRAHRDRLQKALEESAWDGDWYLRAYYDDGTPLGSARSTECRIDALVQAWAVLSGAASPERAVRALDAVERNLVLEEDGLIRLLTPPFEKTTHDPGYIKGYLPGVRENGGQYTHAAMWVVQATARLRRTDRAAQLLEMLSPVTHALTQEQAERYKVEPYVVAADVYGAPPHVGHGGWTWYTGSAGWMFRVALESVLGVRLENGDTLILKPCVPAAWKEYRVEYRVPGDEERYEIHVLNPEGKGTHVLEARLDGRPVPVVNGAARIALRGDGAAHQVRVTLGLA